MTSYSLKIAALHNFHSLLYKTAVIFLFFVNFLSGLRQVALFMKSLHIRPLAFKVAVPGI